MPAGRQPGVQDLKQGRRTVQAVSAPKQILHVLGHYPRHILQVVVKLVELTRGSGGRTGPLGKRPRVFV